MSKHTGYLRKSLAALVGTGILAATPLLAPAPAQAAVTGSMATTGTTVLYGDCRDYSVNYALAITPGTTYWNLDFEVYGPDGLDTSSGAYIYSSSYPSSGTVGIQLCGSLLEPGTYTVRATGEWSDSTSSYRPYALTPVTFQARLPETTTSLKKVTINKDRYRLTATVKDERPNGKFPTDYATVRFEEYTGGRWRNVRSLQSSTENGRVTVTVGNDPRKRTKVRAVVRTTDDYTGSQSRPVTL